tara:strand:+ start:4507 stop:5736 length:1230 start_codon:yes stop_codon:yes gene_type:complete
VKAQHCVIVGASHAAAELCIKLRKEGWQGRITLVGEEDYLPYNRPPLSKTFLAGEKSVHDLLIRHATAYEKADVDCLPGIRAEAIDRENHILELGNGEQLNYDKLVLTTGARVRKLSLPGADLGNIFYLRSIYDADQIRPHIKPGKHAVIVGGGYIGLETAAMLKSAGMRVTVLERDQRLLNRVAAPEISDFFTRIHNEEGIEIITAADVEAFSGDEAVQAVQTSNLGEFTADLVIVGVGVIPNVELAEQAGLAIKNGIEVNAYTETSDADILAAGDCTFHFNKHYQRWMRLESIQNAVEQAEVSARTLCGLREEYDVIPWFWSDQFDLKLQIAGLSEGYDNLIVRGELSQGRKLSVFYFSGEKLLAVDAVNSPQEFMFGKRALAQFQALDRERLADTDVSMRDLLLTS